MPPAIYLIAFERDKEEELQEASVAKKIQKRYEKQIDAEKKECYKIGYQEMNTCIQSNGGSFGLVRRLQKSGLIRQGRRFRRKTTSFFVSFKEEEQVS